MPTGKPLLEHIDQSFSRSTPSIEASWIATYSAEEWWKADYEDDMRKGRTILIHNSETKKGWSFDVPCGRHLKPGQDLVEVQGECILYPDTRESCLHDRRLC